MSVMNTVIQCGLIIASSTLPRGVRLEDHAHGYLCDRGFSIDLKKIEYALEKKYNYGALLYGKLRNKPDEIEKTGYIRDMYRNLWLFDLVAHSYGSITASELFMKVYEKFEAEKRRRDGLKQESYPPLNLVQAEFGSTDKLTECGRALSVFAADCSRVMCVVGGSISRMPSISYLTEIFTPFSASAANDSGAGTVSAGVGSVSVPSKTAEAAVSEEDEVKAQLLRLKDTIGILEKEKHELEVKLAHAQKDAVRDIIESLTAFGWNSPLSELFRISKESDTPERIRGIINNLFGALEADGNIKVYGGVGTEITLTEDNQIKYTPYKNEELYLGDRAVVYYPGYRYGRDVMLRPTVRKPEDSGE